MGWLRSSSWIRFGRIGLGLTRAEDARRDPPRSVDLAQSGTGSVDIPSVAVTDLLASDRLARSVSRVTATMLGLAFRAVAPAIQLELWWTAVSTIAGARPITVALSSDRRGCAALAAAV
jgi:hypothetical protein